MPESTVPSLEDLEGLIIVLEQERLELLGSIVLRAEGYDDEDLQTLSIHGNAIRSIRDAIEFIKRRDAVALSGALKDPDEA